MDRDLIKKEIDKWFEAKTDEMISDLSKLIEINSVRSKSEPGAPFGQNSRKALTLAEEMLEKRGFKATVFNDMIVTAETGPEKPLVAVLAHLDIVDAGEGWSTNPFELVVKDGKLFGRGVMDNKGPSIAAMYALYCINEINPKLKHGVQIILGTAEETGFDDIKQYMENNEMPPYVFSPDAEFPVINTEKGNFVPTFNAKWEKDTTLPRIISITGGKTPNIIPNRAEAIIEGISKVDVETFCEKFTKKTGVTLSIEKVKGDTITIQAEGLAAHASLPERANNAQTALIEMLASMPFAKSEGFGYLCALNKLFPHGDYRGTAIGIDMEDEISGRTTVNFGVLRFDEYEFSGNFDSRTPICADDVDIMDIIRKALEKEGLNISHVKFMHGHHTPKDNPLVQTLLKVFTEYTGKEAVARSLGGLTYVHGIPGGVAFGCAYQEDDNKVHGANEFIKLEQLITSAKMFTLTLVDMCGS
ncbi:MAG: Sapep family Mn(2+)-dependent dipeptidase [Oscillospiraceae bacterium]|nr:Sapep family Mn(2+)-dependent dipeptidase [Oscillospiraceae bacterium]